MTRYTVRHDTRYSYSMAVELGLHVLHLSPPSLPWQNVLGQTIAVFPEPTRMGVFDDHFGNQVHRVAIETTHHDFSVTLDATIDVMDRAACPAVSPPWETVREAMRMDGFPSPPTVAEFVYPSPLAAPDNAATAYASESFSPGRPIVDAVRDLTARIHRDFAYIPQATDVSTQVAKVMEMRRGVCQDFAHVMIAGLRGLGLPARYVSGYIHTGSGDGGRLVGADASHAWVATWCGDEIGWIELDPTNDLLANREHVVVAYGRDFSDVTPLRGVILGGGNHTLSVAVNVTAVGG